MRDEYEECPDCSGTGTVRGGTVICGLCEGDGEVFVGTHKRCGSCGGDGHDPIEGTCLSCGGTGAVPR